MSNPTSNFNWQMPTATDLVTDLPADFEVFGQAVDTSLADLKGGTTGQILAKNSNTNMDFVWITNDVGDITEVTAGTGISGGGTSGAVTITNSMATEITAKADLIVGTGNAAFDNLPVGANGTVLTADSTVSPTGLKWATPGAAFVGVRAITSSASIVYVSGADNAIPYAAEDYDTDSFHDNSVNNSRITIPSGKGGKYLITGQLEIGNAVTSYLQLRLYKNGSLLNAQLGRLFNWSAAGNPMINGSTVLSLAAGDYIQLMATASDAFTSNTFSSFTATYLGA